MAKFCRLRVYLLGLVAENFNGLGNITAIAAACCVLKFAAGL
jgi:hypothetical protein